MLFAFYEFNAGKSALRPGFFIFRVLCLVLVVALGFSFFSGQPAGGGLVRLDVVNVDTGLSYFGIQEAINAVETVDGHTIRVGYGVFQENVVVNKSVSLVGYGPELSVIDGMRGGVVVEVVSDFVEIRSLCIRNGVIGLRLDHARNCRVVDNVLHDGAYGIRLLDSGDAFVAGNRISGYYFFGLELDASGNSTLRENWLSHNRYGFGVDGSSLVDFLNDVDDSNFVNGKPIRYFVNYKGFTAGSSTFDDVGYLGFVNSSDIVVEQLEVQGSVQGVLFAFTVNSSIFDVKVSNNWNGVFVAHSRNVTVSGVKANGNFDYGIKFVNSSGSRAFGNDADRNGWAGIGLFLSPYSVVWNNEVSFNTYDLHIVYTNNSEIAMNLARSKPSGYSIALFYAHNNSIYRNVFDNSLLFRETRDGVGFVPVDRWDNGVDGNFWYSYRGQDNDNDGIGDTAYRVGEKNLDNCPLMGRFHEFDIVVQGRVYKVAAVSNSTVSDIQFSPNEGRIDFAAVGPDRTSGFSRMTIPVDLIQASKDGALSFLVNNKEPVYVRNWSDENHVYWYLYFANSSSLVWFSWLFIVFAASLSLAVGALVVFWRRRARSK